MRLSPNATINPSSDPDASGVGIVLNDGDSPGAGTAVEGEIRASHPRPWRWILASVAWLIVVGTGTLFLLEYSETAGSAGSAPKTIPAASMIKLGGAKPKLIMFAHPHCPCSGASVAELDRLLAASGHRLEAHVLFMLPEGMDDSWSKGHLWRRAAAIPGVQVNVDRNGFEAALYGAATSGQCVLYGADGSLLFQGGITPARGHHGDSVGAEAIRTLLRQPAASVAVAPVFGCELCQEGGAQ